MCLYPFAGTNVFSTKNMCFAIWARVDTKFLNLSHHVLSVDGWPGDATFSCGANLWRSCKYSAKKGPAHWILFLTLAPRPLQVTFFGWWSWTYAVVAYCKDRCMFSKKTCVSQIGRALTQDSWICPIMSYLWMVGLMMRLFPAGPTFEDHPHVFSQKKVQPLGFYFWHLRLGLFKSRFLVGEAKHMCLYPFAGIVVFSTKNMYFAIWARVDTKFLNLSHHVLAMDCWPGDATFFLRGQPLKIIRMYSAKKKVQPLGFYFWHLRLGLFKSLFQCLWKWSYLFVPFCKDKCIFSKKNVCFAIWVRIDTFFEFVPDVQATQIQHNDQCMSISKDLNPGSQSSKVM